MICKLCVFAPTSDWSDEDITTINATSQYLPNTLTLIEQVDFPNWFSSVTV